MPLSLGEVNTRSGLSFMISSPVAPGCSIDTCGRPQSRCRLGKKSTMGATCFRPMLMAEIRLSLRAHVGRVTFSPHLRPFSNLKAQASAWRPSPGHTQEPIWPGIAPDAAPGPDVRLADFRGDHVCLTRLV